MIKYYVYHVKNEDPNQRVNAFVEDPRAFALNAFNPNTMEFSGVLVEANDPEEAHKIYLHPKENDILISCDEPRPTKLKRNVFESQSTQSKLKEIKDSLDKAEIVARNLFIQVLILEIANDFNEIAIRISELSHTLWESGTPEDQKKFSSKYIYERLMQKYTDQFSKLKYRPGGTIEG